MNMRVYVCMYIDMCIYRLMCITKISHMYRDHYVLYTRAQRAWFGGHNQLSIGSSEVGTDGHVVSGDMCEKLAN